MKGWSRCSWRPFPTLMTLCDYAIQGPSRHSPSQHRGQARAIAALRVASPAFPCLRSLRVRAGPGWERAFPGALGAAQGERELRAWRGRSVAGGEPGFGLGGGEGGVGCLMEFVLSFPGVLPSGISTSQLRGGRRQRLEEVGRGCWHCPIPGTGAGIELC